MKNETTIFNIISKLFLLCFLGILLIMLINANIVFGIIVLFGSIVYLCYKYDIPHFPVLLLVFSFLIRLFFILTVNTPVESDFYVMYEAAKQFSKGDMSFGNTDYFQCWGGQTGLVIFNGMLLKIWNNIFFLKLFNCIASALTNLIIYLIAKEYFSKKASQCVSIYYSVFVFAASFVTVLSNQHLSTLLVYTAIYLIVARKFDKINNIIKFIIAGILLVFANIIRPDVMVVIVAICVYCIFEMFKERNIKNFLNYFIILVSFVLTYFLLSKLLSNIVIWTGINSQGLKTNDYLLKFAFGTSVDSSGGYSQNILNKIEELQLQESITRAQAEIKIIKENLSKGLPEIINLIKNKIMIFWFNDSLDWSFYHLNCTSLILFAKNIDRAIFTVTFILSSFGAIPLLCRKNKDVKTYILPFLVFATFFVYLLIEIQPRYAHMIQVAIFIMAAGAIDIFINTANLIKDSVNSHPVSPK